MSQDSNIKDIHKFVHIEQDADIEIIGSTVSLEELEDKLKNYKETSSVIIEDSTSGFVELPNRLPLGVVVGFVTQLIVLVVGGTTMWSSMTAKLDIQSSKIASLEANMYTKSEAMLRQEYTSKDIEELKNLLSKKDRN